VTGHTCELEAAFVFEDLAALAGFAAATSPAPFCGHTQAQNALTHTTSYLLIRVFKL